MKNLNPSKKWQWVYLLMYMPFIVTILSHIFVSGVRLKAETWQITELLINYQGGFIRRGLIGEIMYYLNNTFEIDVIIQAYTFSIVSFLLFSYIIIKDTIKRGYSILMLPTAMLLSSLFVSGHWVRKDIFIMLLFYAVVRLLKNKSFLNYLLANILLIIGTLSHEVILFIAAPAILVSQLMYNSERVGFKNLIKGVSTSVLYFLPVLATSILIAINKGDFATAQAIWDSWAQQDVLNTDIKGAIAGVGWSSEYAIEYGTTVWHTVRCGVYYPIMWTILSLSAFVIFVWMYKPKPQLLGYRAQNDFSTQESIYIIVVQFIAIIPLLLVFADTSRLFFYVIMSAYIIRLYDDNHCYTMLFGDMPRVLANRIDTVENYITNHQKSFIAFAFIIGLPSISVSALEHVVLHGQVGFFFKSIIDMIKAL